jgi:prolyl-tRNA synthetase
MVHGDDKGLIIPPKVAPIQVVIVPIYRAAESEKVKAYAYEISTELQKFDMRVQVDDRDEYTSGWKFNEWEIKGVPLRLNIGPRDIQNESVEVVRRDTGEKIGVKRRNFAEYIVTLLDSIQKNLFRRALDDLSKNTLTIDDYNLFKTRLEQKGGLIYAGWCGKAECESKIKEETGADIRILPFQTEHGVKPVCCICCNTTATELAVFARAY